MPNTRETIGPLRLQKKLGVGKLSEVWTANDTSAEGADQQKLWAVKFLVADAAGDREQRKLFEHELRVSKSLAHPGIVRIDRFEVLDDIPLLVMELFDHPNLKTQLAETPEPLMARLPRILTEAALALAHMHARGWIHRDIKPDNLLASPEGQVKLIDMALAVKKPGVLGRLLGGAAPRGRGLVQGTPSYMSPEVVRSGHYDYQSDIYAFGVSMYEIFTGKPPFSGGDEFDRAVRNLNSPVIPPREVNANVPPELDRIVLRAMEKDPRKRYESMDSVVQELGRIVRSTASESTRILIEDDTRRMHERIRERCYLHYYLKTWVSKGPKEVAVTDNISVGGVSFCVRQAPEIGANLQMEIQPRAAATRIQATGKVVRVGEKDSTGLTSIGVEFSKIAPRDQERFQKYIQQRKTVDAPITESTNYGN